MAPPIHVVYIAGWGRSGSTLLDNLLGSLPGFLSCGELRYFWRRGLIENRLCADGIAFREHPFWRKVVEATLSESERLDGLAELLAGERLALRPAVMLPRLACGAQPAMVPGSAQERYVGSLAKLYRAIADTSGCSYLVDSSKNPVYAWWLSQVPGVALHVVHLLRDPRAVAFSWQRRKAQPDKAAQMDRHGTLRATLHWRLANAAAERLALRCPGAYVQLPYERFISEPRASLDRLADWLGVTEANWPLDDEGCMSLAPGLAFSGNPSRFRSGPVRLSLDDEWRRALSPWRRTLVETLAGPALARYGYS